MFEFSIMHKTKLTIHKSGLKAQGCGKLKKAVFSIELDEDEEEAAEE